MKLTDYLTSRPQGMTYQIGCNCGDNDAVPSGWQCDQIDALGELSTVESIIRNNDMVFSPIVWEHGHRKEVNFQKASFVGLDFDDGVVSLSTAEALFADCDAYLYTTRSHGIPKGEEPACDRFRVFIGLSRPVNLLEWKRLHLAMFELMPGLDMTCGDGARMFRAGVADSHVRAFCGTKVLDVEKLLAYAKEKKLDAKAKKGQEFLESFADVRDDGMADAYLARTVKQWVERIWPQWESENLSTYQRFWRTCLFAFDKATVAHGSTVAATLKTIPWIAEWLYRHPHQAKTFTQQIRKAGAAWVANTIYESQHEPLEPVNTVLTLSGSELPPVDSLHQKVIDTYRTANGYTGTLGGDYTHRLFRQAAESWQRSILASPCGAEKTSAARCYVAAHAHVRRRFLIVKRTREDCRTERAELQKIYSGPIGLLTGWDAKQCNTLRGTMVYRDADWRAFYAKKTSPCRTCPHNGLCDFGQTLLNHSEQINRPVCIATHKNLLTMLACGTVPALPTVIIDEALEWFETYTLTPKDHQQISRYLPATAAAQFNQYVSDLKNLTADGSVREDTKNTFTLLDYENIVKELYADNSLPPTAFEAVWAWVSFMKNGVRARFVMKSSDNLKFIKPAVEVADLPNRIIILDGSAEYSSVVWDGFTLYRLKEHQHEYPNLILHVIPCNPTKVQLQKRMAEWMSAVDAIAARNPTAEVILCTNKDENVPVVVRQFVEQVKAKHPHLILMYRGSITGSNAGCKAGGCIIAMSLFTDVSDYALRAALAHWEEIEPERIWTPQGKPKMHSGFDDPQVNAEYRRRYVDEAYQTLMRGVVRTNPDAEYHVVLAIDGLDMLVELEKLIPKFRVEVAGDSPEARRLKGYVQLRDGGFASVKSYSKLAELMGGHHGDEQSQAVKEIVAVLETMKVA